MGNLNSVILKIKFLALYLKYILLAFVILFIALLAVPVTGFQVFLEVMGRIDPIATYSIFLVGPKALASASVFLMLIVLVWSYIALIIWVVRDSRKFKAIGINIHPFLWGIGMIYPLVFVVFPLYLVRRNITWQKTLTLNTSESDSGNEKVKEKRKWARAGITIVIIFFVIIPVFASLLKYVGIKNRMMGDFLVNFSLAISCAGEKSGCDEQRSLPTVLQNKKIVFYEDTSIRFEPRRDSEVDFTELDTLGSLDAHPKNSFHEDIVDPKLGERGYLLEREYKIIRAVHHYNCSYCIGGGNYSYVVLEDTSGNRFIAHLNKWDISSVPAKDIPWDEQLPYELGEDKEFGKLVEINELSQNK